MRRLFIFLLLFNVAFLSAQKSKFTEAKLIILNDSLTLQQYDSIVSKEFENGKIPILYFGATWCGPCKEFKKNITENQYLKTKLKDFTFIQADLSDLNTCEGNTKLGNILGCRNWHGSVPRFSKVDKKGVEINYIMGSGWFMQKPLRIDEFIRRIMIPNKESYIFPNLQ
jgi:thioredoxin-related protein